MEEYGCFTSLDVFGRDGTGRIAESMGGRGTGAGGRRKDRKESRDTEGGALARHLEGRAVEVPVYHVSTRH